MPANFKLNQNKKIYFASDLHLGAYEIKDSHEKERKFCEWLNKISIDAQAIYIVGDLFDFWFEYKKVVPKGFTRVLGKLAEISDQGIKIYFLPGNHDLWAKDYLVREVGFEIIHGPAIHSWSGHRFYISHGDGLGPGDTSYKLLKRIFLFKPFNWAFRILHPDLGVKLALWLSKSSRLRSGEKDLIELPKEKEPLFQFAIQESDKIDIDTWIFGHRHLPMSERLPNGKNFINLGDWIYHFTWASFSEKTGIILRSENEYDQKGFDNN